MTSYSVIVSIKSCPEFGNDGYIIMCNFGGRSMSGVEIIGGGGGEGPFEAPSVGGSKIKAGSE